MVSPLRVFDDCSGMLYARGQALGLLEIEQHFPISCAYPMSSDYHACILPPAHPWAEQAVAAMADIRGIFSTPDGIENARTWKTFPGFSNFACEPEHVLFKKKLPFLIKIRFDENPDDNECIKRVLLARRAKKFCAEWNLDGIYVPDKFLILKDPENLDKRMSHQNYATLSEKVKIFSERWNENDIKLWKTLDPAVRKRRKMQKLFLMAKLGFADGFPRNVPLLEDGRFCFIDTNEPPAKKLFSVLLKGEEDGTGSSRALEIEYAKIGLFRSLLDGGGMPYDEEENKFLYCQWMAALAKELFTNQIHQICRAIKPDSRDRIENLKERVFFGSRNHFFIEAATLVIQEVFRGDFLSYSNKLERRVIKIITDYAGISSSPLRQSLVSLSAIPPRAKETSFLEWVSSLLDRIFSCLLSFFTCQIN